MKKKPFWETTFGKITKSILTLGIGMIAKNQKGIKNTNNEQKVDDILKNIP